MCLPTDRNRLHGCGRRLGLLTPEQKLLLPLFRSLNFENALNSHLEMTQKKDDLAFEIKKKETELDRRISDLDEQISSTYERYSTVKKDIIISELLK